MLERVLHILNVLNARIVHTQKQNAENKINNEVEVVVAAIHGEIKGVLEEELIQTQLKITEIHQVAVADILEVDLAVLVVISSGQVQEDLLLFLDAKVVLQ